MSGEYRGETNAKRVARLILGRSIQQQLASVTTSSRPKAICLAGDGGDARMLRALGMPVADIVCVDRDEAALRKVSLLVPGADFRLGDIRTVIGTLADDSLCCALLDFCGHVTRTVRFTVRLIARKLQVPGFLSVTYLRGRETLTTAGIREGKRCWDGQEHLLRPDEKMQAYREWYGAQIAGIVTQNRNWAETIYVLGAAHRDRVAIRVHGARSPTNVHPNRCPAVDGSWWLDERDLILYHSGHSPMCIVSFGLSRSMPQPGEHVVVKTSKCESELRIWAMKNPELTAQRVADSLNLPVGTIAAWRAHATRGTYKQEEQS